MTDPIHNPEAPDAGRDSRADLVAHLFREHNQALLRFLSAKMGSRQDAREVAQEAYVRLLNLDTSGAVSYLRAFLFKTAANIAIDRIRSRRAEARRLEIDFFSEPATEPDPERRALAAEELRILEDSLQRLPPKCRQAFLLKRFDDLSCAEIAERMRIPERTVRHYIVEAIAYCQSRLERNAAPGRQS